MKTDIHNKDFALKVDLPQVDLTRIPGKMFWRGKCDFFGREADERATKSREVPRAIKMRRRTFRKSTLRLVSKEKLRGTRKWPIQPTCSMESKNRAEYIGGKWVLVNLSSLL